MSITWPPDVKKVKDRFSKIRNSFSNNLSAHIRGKFKSELLFLVVQVPGEFLYNI